jgi:transcriptional regulator with XRE-family HTH domain
MNLRSTARMAPVPQFRRTFIRAWREYRGLTLEELAAKIDKTASQLSMLERGQRGYSQTTLEAIATALKTTTAALLSRDPEAEENGLFTLWENADPKERRMIERIAKGVVKPED